ncbi:MAG: class I SAM-dependent methyltransferase [bacterium]
MKRETALKILDQMKENYNLVAGEFSSTRRSSWEEIKPLADYVHPGGRILDLGCGNGRLVESFKGKKIDYLGIDNSEMLIEEARKKYPENKFIAFDGLKIPFEDYCFDTIFCIAVLHHIPSRQMRIEFLKEANRVLKPGGRLILTVWYFWTKRTYWRLFSKFTLKKIFGKSELDFFDIKQPWFKTAERYLHFFRKGELKNLIEETGFVVEKINIFRKGPENKNFLVIAKK